MLWWIGFWVSKNLPLCRAIPPTQFHTRALYEDSETVASPSLPPACLQGARAA